MPQGFAASSLSGWNWVWASKVNLKGKNDKIFFRAVILNGPLRQREELLACDHCITQSTDQGRESPWLMTSVPLSLTWSPTAVPELPRRTSSPVVSCGSLWWGCFHPSVFHLQWQPPWCQVAAPTGPGKYTYWQRRYRVQGVLRAVVVHF